jgi:hypothetical protein
MTSAAAKLRPPFRILSGGASRILTPVIPGIVVRS